MCVAALPNSALSKWDPENGSVQDLPTPGYEPRLIRKGSIVLGPQVKLSAIGDSNVFATSTNEDADIVYLVEPSVSFNRQGSNSTFKANTYASIRQFAEYTQENVNTFGVEASTGHRLNSTHIISTNFGFDRTFERRNDPESSNNLAVSPTNINILSGDVGYIYRPGRFGLALRAGASKADYLATFDDDRDLTTYRVSVRSLVAVSNKIDVFVEGYNNWRDARTAVDRTGINRDNSTLGINAGFAFDITGKLQGEAGIGYFNASQDDPVLENFSGLGASGRLSWRPNLRTSVSVSFFRGDVATVRFGANGRIDTRIGLDIIQEVRHNLLLRGNINYRQGEFRTALEQTETDFNIQAGAEYLLNRHIAVALDYSLRSRNATILTDEYEGNRLGLSLKLTY